MASRAPRGTGTVYKRKDGRYEGAAYVLTADGGRRRVRAYGATRLEAHVRIQELVEQTRKGVPVATSAPTVSSWLDKWMSDVVAVKNRPRTVELYEATIRLHIKPHLGGKKLTLLSVTDVQSAINALLAAGHSPRTVHKMRTVLSAALGRAQREEIVLRNVARLVELPAYERKTIHPWNAEQATRFLDEVHGHQWEAGYQLLILCGMRRGEVLGLRWSDIDFNAGTINVTQQLQRISGQLETGPVKTTAGRRTLPLLPTVKRTLIAVAEQRSIDVTDTSSLGDQLVLVSATGQPVEPGNFARAFHTLTERAKLPRITVHHTRHTAATLLKHLGVPARDAQLILGHSNVTTTQQLYQHGDIDAQRDALSHIEHALTTSPHAERSNVREDVAAGGVSRQRRLTGVPSAPERDPADDSAGNENRRLTEAETAEFLGGSGGARTHDILLKRLIPTLAGTLPTSVIDELHTRTRRHILGRVAVRISRQTVASPVFSTADIDDLTTLRDACQGARFEQLRTRSFPLNLISKETLA